MEAETLSGFIKGTTLGFTLILAIGAQNAFVLRCGVRNHHPLSVAITCTLADALLISLGVFGVGQFIANMPLLRGVLGGAGVIFLLVYGGLAFRSALRGMSSLDMPGQEMAQSTPQRLTLIVTTLGFSLLNPHAILDTVVLIGGIAAQYTQDSARYGFAGGTILASTVFFFSLALGARALAPVLSHPRAMRLLDGCVGCLMWGIALVLLRSVIDDVFSMY